MARITLNVDGSNHAIDADPDMPLLYALRNDLGLNNPHFGLWARPMRRLYRPCRWRSDPLVRNAGRQRRQRQGGDPHRPGDAGKSTSVAESLCRRAGAAMRLLHQWMDHDRGRDAGKKIRNGRTRKFVTNWPGSNAVAAPTWRYSARSSAPPKKWHEGGYGYDKHSGFDNRPSRGS